MKKIYLMIAPGRQSTEALHFALHKAKETGATLTVVYVTDHEKGDPLQSRKVLEEMEKQARTFQVPVETALKAGLYFDLCGEFSRKEDAALLVVTEKKNSFLKKMFEESGANKLKDRVSCEIKIYPS